MRFLVLLSTLLTVFAANATSSSQVKFSGLILAPPCSTDAFKKDAQKRCTPISSISTVNVLSKDAEKAQPKVEGKIEVVIYH